MRFNNERCSEFCEMFCGSSETVKKLSHICCRLFCNFNGVLPIIFVFITQKGEDESNIKDIARVDSTKETYNCDKLLEKGKEDSSQLTKLGGRDFDPPPSRGRARREVPIRRRPSSWSTSRVARAGSSATSPPRFRRAAGQAERG